MKKILFTLFILSYTLGVWADNVEIDGIYYSLDEAKHCCPLKITKRSLK